MATKDEVENPRERIQPIQPKCCLGTNEEDVNKQQKPINGQTKRHYSNCHVFWEVPLWIGTTAEDTGKSKSEDHGALKKLRINIRKIEAKSFLLG
ncbi:hypothetical protein Trydic_g6210 [Trypoxylus dichotomus]